MSSSQALGIGTGLVEIAALTALVGASTAESLVLGSRGACGLPWAGLTSFGSIFVVKACISACTPPWLRDTVGVRSKGSDAAVGLSESLERKTKAHSGGEAVGVAVTINKDVSSKATSLRCEQFADVYAFDEFSDRLLHSCTLLGRQDPLIAHTYIRYPEWLGLHQIHMRSDWVRTSLTLFKLLEMYLLYYFGSKWIFWVTGLTWMYFFLAAVVLQLCGLGRAYYRPGHTDQCLDILAGRLPMPQVAGEDRRVLFDVPVNVRKSPVWLSVWALGSVVSAASLVVTYIFLAKEPSTCIKLWLGYQFLWVLLRSVFFYLAPEKDDNKHILVPPLSVNHQPIESNLRFLALASAVSRYQVLNHPRGSYSYTDDVQDPAEIRDLLAQANFEFIEAYNLLGEHNVSDTVEISVTAVIGDTLLSSAAWMIGSPLTGMDLYDCCILALQTQSSTILIPAARVLAGRTRPETQKDPESTLSSGFFPKGVSNIGSDLSWVYWIPCSKGLWLTFATPWTVGGGRIMPATGKVKMSVTTGSEITAVLQSKVYLISLTSVDDVEDTVKKSNVVARILRDVVKEPNALYSIKAT